MAMKRRDLLKLFGTGAGLWAIGVPAGARARVGRSHLILLNLRGGVDGLALVPPYGEPSYATHRAALSLAAPGADQGLLKLDGLFGLHPKLPALHGFYERGEALFFHAVATPYRDRSHFDAQKVLENGTTTPGELSGWVNRSITSHPELKALAIGANVPLIARGTAPVQTWSPSLLPEIDDDTLRRVRDLYQRDPFFAKRLAEALEAPDAGSGNRRRRNRGQIYHLLNLAVEFLLADDGPDILTLDWDGWDTHANQGGTTGALANKLAQLDGALERLAIGLGASWRDTVIIVFTEFGRTVRTNGTRGTDHGTDHGTGTLAFAVGGSVQGGRIVSDWPGLNPTNLFQNRDLKPTRDVRELFASALVQHLGIDEGPVANRIFPGIRLAPLDLV